MNNTLLKSLSFLVIFFSISACKSEAEKREEARHKWEQEYKKILEQDTHNRWDCKYAYSERQGNPGKAPTESIWKMEGKDPLFKQCIEDAQNWFVEQRGIHLKKYPK